MPTVHHIAFTAADLTHSGTFYDAVPDVLGYQREHASSELIIWTGPGPEILVYPVKANNRAPHTHARPGLQHLALHADTPPPSTPSTPQAGPSSTHRGSTPNIRSRRTTPHPSPIRDGIRLKVAHILDAPNPPKTAGRTAE